MDGMSSIPYHLMDGSSTVEYCYSWICIARLVQIMLTMLPELTKCERHASKPDMLNEFPFFAPLLKEIYIRLIRAGLLEKVVRSSVEKCAGPAANAPECLDAMASFSAGSRETSLSYSTFPSSRWEHEIR